MELSQINLTGIARSNKTKRIALIITGIVFAAELVWAASVIQKNISPVKEVVTQPVSVNQVSGAIISLETSQTDFKVGEKINVTVNIESKKATDGIDLVIKYNPKELTVVPVDVDTKAPFLAGTIYSDYPLNSVDEKKGIISVSGISSLPEGVIPDGVLGTLTFIASEAGKSAVALEFTPGNTTDTNVTETKTAKDILTSVKNLEVNIIP